MCVVAKLHVGSCTAGRLDSPARIFGDFSGPTVWYLDFTHNLYMYLYYLLHLTYLNYFPCSYCPHVLTPLILLRYTGYSLAILA